MKEEMENKARDYSFNLSCLIWFFLLGIVKELDKAIYDDYNSGQSFSNTIYDDRKCKAG